MLDNGSTTIIMLHVLIAVLLQELLSVDDILNNADLTDLSSIHCLAFSAPVPVTLLCKLHVCCLF